MKKLICLIATVGLISYSLPLSAQSMEGNAQITDSLYRAGAGATDGAWTATSVSMLGWGLGLAAGIGILAAVLHQSTSHSH